MSFMKSFISADDVSPRDVASLLTASLQFPDPKLDIALGLRDHRQAGQFLRRVRERLSEQGVQLDQFGVKASEDSPTIEFWLPKSLRERLEPEEPREYEEPATVVPSRLNARTEERDIPEGDYKVVLQRVERQERAGRFFAVITWQVADGDLKSQSFQDKVMVWPVDVRAQHFGRAVKLTPEKLADKLDSLVGSRVWDRRREIVREDGTVRMVNHYYPLEWTPPPNWK